MLIFDAIENNDVQLVKSIVDSNKSVLKTIHGRTPLRPFHYACFIKRTEVIKLLLNYVDPESVSDNGLRVIYYVCYHNNIEIVKLVVNSVNLEAEDINRTRPIHYACKYSDIEIVRLLVDGFIGDRIYSNLPRVEIECRNKFRISPLDVTRNPEIMDFLKYKIFFVKRTLFVQISNHFCDVKLIC
jgi:ankyrin repeat protein